MGTVWLYARETHWRVLCAQTPYPAADRKLTGLSEPYSFGWEGNQTNSTPYKQRILIGQEHGIHRAQSCSAVQHTLLCTVLPLYTCLVSIHVCSG